MKIIVVKKDGFDTRDAHAVMLELEAELGVNLHVADPKNPNQVHGFVNTSGDGTVEVHLYEDADVQKIDAAPQLRVDPVSKSLVRTREHNGIYRTAEKTDSALVAGVENVMTRRGFAAVLAADGSKIHTN